jgi:hypothetical protein
MKTRKILTLFIALICNIGIFAQGITNNGSTITISTGTAVTVSNGGGYYNLTNGANHGQIDLDGQLWISGDFINQCTDASSHVFTNVDLDGFVVFNGTVNQHISNTTPNAYINFERLYIYTGSTTLLDAGSAATVNNDLNVYPTATFRLSSPSNGEGPSGSLITNVVTNTTGALWVDRHYETALRYVYISAPVSNAVDDQFTVGWNGAFNPNLYSYNESYNAAVDPPGTVYAYWSDPTYGLYNAWVQVANNGSSVPLSNNAAGYIVYNDIETDVNYGGSPSNLNNLASYSPTISYNPNDNTGGAGDYFDGWNIIGNPYPSALDWNSISKTNVNNTVYYWDGDIGNYKYYNGIGGTQVDDGSNVVNGGTQYIPAMQGFAIKASASSPSITIAKSSRIHNTQQLWKSSKENPNYGQTEFVKLKTSNNDFSDETIVRFIEDAVNDFDNQYDAYKMFGSNPDLPMIYSLTTTNVIYPLAINSLPISTLGTTVPLGYKTETAGTYSITVEDFVFNAGTEVSLIDTYMEKSIALEEGTEYSFTFNGGENRDRFYLFVAPEGSNEIIDETDVFSMNVWGAERSIHIVIQSNEMVDANVEVFDILGKSVVYKHIAGNYNVIQIPGSSGTYIVKVIANNGTSQIRKVFIEK